MSGARKGHSRFLERLWYPTPFDFFKPPDKPVSGFDGVGLDPCLTPDWIQPPDKPVSGFDGMDRAN